MLRIVVFYTFFTLAAALQGQERHVLTCGWGGLWEPYRMGTPGQATGLDIDILKAVMTEAGYELRHTPNAIPWSDLLHLVRLGEVDLLVGAGRSEEREQYAYFIGPYRRELLALFVRKGTSSRYPFKEPEDLIDSNFVLGTNSNYNYGKRLEQVFRRMGPRVIDMRDPPDLGAGFFNRRKLLAGRIDGYLSYPIEEASILRSEQLLDQIERHPMERIDTGAIYYMLSKATVSSETAERLQASLETIKANGVYGEIVEQYAKRYGADQW